jgi:hypothetical protein
VTVAYATRNHTSGLTAIADDYTSVSGQVTFVPGETTQTFSVPIRADPANEEEELITLILSSPENARLGEAEATLIIENDDPLPGVYFAQPGYSVAEDVGVVTIVVTVTQAAGKVVTVDYASQADSADADSDFTPTSGTLQFGWGEWTQTFNVPIIDDDTDEPDETITLILTDPTNATLGTPASITLTILDDDVPEVSFESSRYRVVEGVGSTSATPTPDQVNAGEIAVILDQPSWQTVTVDYTTVNDTATAENDYITISGTLTFRPGEVRKTFTVRSRDDRLYEGDEVVKLRLSNPVNAVLGTATADLIIVENDPRDTTGPTFRTPSVEPPQIRVDCDSTQAVTLSIVVSDPSGVANVQLRYQLPEEAWSSKLMQRRGSGDTYQATINIDSDLGSLRFQFIAADNAGNSNTSRVYSINVENNCSGLR